MANEEVKEKAIIDLVTTLITENRDTLFKGNIKLNALFHKFVTEAMLDVIEDAVLDVLEDKWEELTGDKYLLITEYQHNNDCTEWHLANNFTHCLSQISHNYFNELKDYSPKFTIFKGTEFFMGHEQIMEKFFKYHVYGEKENGGIFVDAYFENKQEAIEYYNGFVLKLHSEYKNGNIYVMKPNNTYIAGECIKMPNKTNVINIFIKAYTTLDNERD